MYSSFSNVECFQFFFVVVDKHKYCTVIFQNFLLASAGLFVFTKHKNDNALCMVEALQRR